MPDKQHLYRFGKRDPDSHKGTYGRVLVLAGSEGFTGAAYLAATGAARSGAGLVTLGVPRSILDVLASKHTCVMTKAFSETSARSFDEKAAEEVLDYAEPFDAVALGPGLSTHQSTARFVARLTRKLEKPLVIDADGINCLARDVDALSDRQGVTVLTPHPGELKRLIGSDPSRHTEEHFREFATRFGNVLVIKRHRTLVTCGKRVYVNSTGNPGMATGGTGDVLTGVIAGFLARGIEAFTAAASAVCLHGMAGDAAAEKFTEEGMIATDLIDSLGEAWKKYTEYLSA